MSALVPRPAEATTPRLTKADVPRYVTAVLAVYAVVDSLGVDDYLRAPLQTLSSALEGRINTAGLSAEGERVASRMRGEAGAAAPVVELRPHLVAQDEAAR